MIAALQHELRGGQVIPFSRFMELALNAPEEGYYERTPSVIGFQGDFITSATACPLFGELLAFQLGTWLKGLEAPQLQLVEAGAHDGNLAATVLQCLSTQFPSLASRLTYILLEPSSTRREWQREKLEHFAGQVQWMARWEDLSQRGVDGVIFSNELLDAMPLRRIAWDAKAHTWFEWGVSLVKEQPTWARLPLDRAEAANLLAQAALNCPPELQQVLLDGFTLDLSPAAVHWWRQAAETLGSGYLVTLDYGLTSNDFWAPSRVDGTVRAYAGQRSSSNVLADAGAQDLTAHVNFSALEKAGEQAGLRTEGLVYQEQFFGAVAQIPAAQKWWTPQRGAQLQTLIHPEHFGRSFRVLVQTRDLASRPADNS